MKDFKGSQREDERATHKTSGERGRVGSLDGGRLGAASSRTGGVTAEKDLSTLDTRSTLLGGDGRGEDED